jgi:7-keto-8-aminopelargonate synthetase-like enzyme
LGGNSLTFPQRLSGFGGRYFLRQAAIAAIEEFGVGAGASRLISGTQSPVVLETTLAKWKQTPAAFAFRQRLRAAGSERAALASKQDVVILDKLPRFIDRWCAIQAGNDPGFSYNHPGKLESHLGGRDGSIRRRGWLLLGNRSSAWMGIARSAARAGRKKRFGASLLLDEAHAIGVVGRHGRGLAAELGLEGEIDLQMGTLSKSLGVSGGYICGSRNLIDWLINRARSFIFSTAPPPALAAAATAAIRFLATPEGEARRQTLWRRILQLRKKLPEGDAAFGKPSAAIIRG